MDQRPSRLPLVIGLLLIAAGWLVVFVGWQQAGRQELETGQLPFLLSGGFGGWGLMLLGVTGVLVDAVQRSRWEASRESAQIHGTLERLVTLIDERLPEPRPDEEKAEPEEEPAPRRRSSSRTAKGRPRAKKKE